ncbi:MAG: CAP domain-containing protein [bacterium]|nr:CAP domain-containing protein [bacterium]
MEQTQENNKREENMDPLYHLALLLLITVLGVIFIFYGFIRSNFCNSHTPRSRAAGFRDTGWESRSSPLSQASVPEDPRAVHPDMFNERLEKLILEKTNRERDNRELPPLLWEGGLSEVARYHSNDMGKNGYFDHQNTRNMGPELRVATIYRRYLIGALAENIYMIKKGKDTPEVLAETILRDWMNSSGHRANILNKEVTTLGVGCVEISKNGQSLIYATQVFGSGIGFLKTDFPYHCQPSQRIPVTVEIASGDHLPATNLLVRNIRNRTSRLQFQMTPGALTTESGSTVLVPDEEGTYQLEFHIPFAANKSAYVAFRGPVFIVKKED